MSKWIAVAAMGAMLAVVGCDNNKDDGTEPQKMSLSSTSGHCAECDAAAKKQAEPKKLSADAKSADCQTQCPAGTAK